MIPSILIFDVGKTNKKLLLFDRQYRVLHEESKKLEETVDEDGFACEDIDALTEWIRSAFDRISHERHNTVKAVNFSAYGASLVYLDSAGQVTAPLYNYLKPFPQHLQTQFYAAYGGESYLSKQTASPILGSLNSGMQLYRIKYEHPEMFDRIRYALHLPQYLSYCVGGRLHSDITSIGCHTHLWDFQGEHYHKWVSEEGLLEKLPPLLSCTSAAAELPGNIVVGGGLHDSSSALIPYLASFRDPFILLSTGTWCISLNPFNHSQLSDYELDNDCLCYLSFEGKPVKASRLFAGYEHEQQVQRLARHFDKPVEFYSTVKCNSRLLKNLSLHKKEESGSKKRAMVGQSAFEKRDLHDFESYEEAYHQLIFDLVVQQVRSTNIVLKGTAVKNIFVDGGFSRNPIYMQLLADSFPDLEVFSASVPQASALGAALAIHKLWNPEPIPAGLVQLNRRHRQD